VYCTTPYYLIFVCYEFLQLFVAEIIQVVLQLTYFLLAIKIYAMVFLLLIFIFQIEPVDYHSAC